MISSMVVVMLMVGMALAMMASKKTSSKEKKRRASKNKDTLLSVFGWEGTYLSLGKAIMAGSVTYVPAVMKAVTNSGVQLSPAEILKGVYPYSTGIPFFTRLNDALVAHGYLITGKVLMPFKGTGNVVIEANAGKCGKAALIGFGVHVAGKTKTAKKLTRGIPVKL